MQSGGSIDRLERVREGAGGGGWYMSGGGSPWLDHKEQRSLLSVLLWQQGEQ